MRKSFLRRFLPVVALLLALPAISNSQTPISIDQAVEIAIKNNPRLKAANASIERNRAAKGETWELAPTALEYGRGNLNDGAYIDNQLNVTQSFGSILTPFYKNALVKNRVENASLWRMMVEKEVTAELKRAWVEYLHSLRLCELYKGQSELAQKLKNIGEQRYQHGEITLLEQKMSHSLSLTMQNMLMQAQRERKVATERLQWVCFSSVPIVPMADTLDLLLPIDMQPSNAPALYLKYQEGLVSEQKALQRIERSRLFPELFAGYQRQSILPQKGLNSWSIGVSIPIFFAPIRSRIRQAGYAAVEAENNSISAIRSINFRLVELRAQIEQFSQSIELYHSSLLPEAAEIKRATGVQLNNQEIDITQAVQAINTAIEIERSYLQTTLGCNIAILEYQLYQ